MNSLTKNVSEEYVKIEKIEDNSTTRKHETDSLLITKQTNFRAVTQKSSKKTYSRKPLGVIVSWFAKN